VPKIKQYCKTRSKKNIVKGVKFLANIKRTLVEERRVLVLISANNLLIYRKYKSSDRNDEYFLAIKFTKKLLLSALPDLKTPSSENLPLHISFKFMLL